MKLTWVLRLIDGLFRKTEADRGTGGDTLGEGHCEFFELPAGHHMVDHAERMSFLRRHNAARK